MPLSFALFCVLYYRWISCGVFSDVYVYEQICAEKLSHVLRATIVFKWLVRIWARALHSWTSHLSKFKLPLPFSHKKKRGRNRANAQRVCSCVSSVLYLVYLFQTFEYTHLMLKNDTITTLTVRASKLFSHNACVYAHLVFCVCCPLTIFFLLCCSTAV